MMHGFCNAPNCSICGTGTYQVQQITAPSQQLQQAQQGISSYQQQLGTSNTSIPISPYSPYYPIMAPPNEKVDLREVVNLIRLGAHIETIMNKLEKIEKMLEAKNDQKMP